MRQRLITWAERRIAANAKPRFAIKHQSTARKRLLAVTLALFGSTALFFLLLFGGNYLATSARQAGDPNPDAPVTCQEQPMRPDQICQHDTTINGHPFTSSEFSYDKQKQYQKEQRIENAAHRWDWLLGLPSCLTGLLLFLSALALPIEMIRYFRERKTERN